jgi:acyl-ACP thioesterase
MLIENFNIRYSELGADGSLPVWALQNYAQQAAAIDAKSFCAGWEDLALQGTAWVLIKLEFEIKGKVNNIQTLQVKTWHSFSDKLKSRREFVFLDEKGEEVACALSWWLILDIKKKRITRTPENMLNKNNLRVLAINESEIKQPKFEGVLPVSEIEITARLEDTDLNGHVNNTHFTAWALEGAPEEIRDQKNLKNIIINFKSEVLQGEKIKIKTFKSEDLSFWHILIRESDAKEIASAYSMWEERKEHS